MFNVAYISREIYSKLMSFNDVQFVADVYQSSKTFLTPTTYGQQ